MIELKCVERLAKRTHRAMPELPASLRQDRVSSDPEVQSRVETYRPRVSDSRPASYGVDTTLRAAIAKRRYSDAPVTFRTARNASWGISTRPTRFIRRLP